MGEEEKVGGEGTKKGRRDRVTMEKYHLNSKRLETLRRKRVDADLITHMQLYERTSLSDTQITTAFIDTQAAIKELD